MKLKPNGAAIAARLRGRYLRRIDLRGEPIRTIPLPVRMVRQGENYRVVDGNGRTIGTIVAPENAPRLGHNEETVFLWREN